MSEQYLKVLWFIKIIDSCFADQPITADYNQTISAEHEYLVGQFMLPEDGGLPTKKGILYKLDRKKKTFFCKTNVVYPFVQFKSEGKGQHLLPMEEYAEVLNYVRRSEKHLIDIVSQILVTQSIWFCN